MEEESKAVQEVAKTTGKAIDAARETGSFIARFVSGPLEQGIGIFEDKLKYLRWERQFRYMQRTQEFLDNAGLQAATRPVPLKLVIPLMQAASIEEDDDLQDKWAALLVNASNASFKSEIRRSYVSILEQLTSLDVRVLDVIYALPFEQTQYSGIVTSQLPAYARVEGEKEQDLPHPPEEVVLSLSNLSRLGCLRPSILVNGGESFSSVMPTLAGKAFVEACRAPGT